MKQEEHLKQLSEITRYTQKKLAALQNSLTKEEVLEYIPNMSLFFVNLISSAVGKEDTVAYMIELLRLADGMTRDQAEQAKRQLERYEKIKEENKNFEEKT